jgi:hypothetical protein
MHLFQIMLQVRDRSFKVDQSVVGVRISHRIEICRGSVAVVGSMLSNVSDRVALSEKIEGTHESITEGATDGCPRSS